MGETINNQQSTINSRQLAVNIPDGSGGSSSSAEALKELAVRDIRVDLPLPIHAFIYLHTTCNDMSGNKVVYSFSYYRKTDTAFCCLVLSVIYC